MNDLKWKHLLSLGIVAWCFATSGNADEGTDFFESKIRPVLVEKCYGCHSAKAQEVGKLKGALLLDTQVGIRKGGESGPAVVPRNAEASLLLAAIRHESFEMPPKGKLPDRVIADFVKWVEMGAPDPRDGTSVVKKDTIDIEAGRKFWSFRPLADVAVPEASDSNWPRSDIDQFVLANLNANRLVPLADAEPRDLVRRLYFDLIGLPPTPEQVTEFLSAAARDRTEAIETLVNDLLDSPHFGERWGRHWLDIARYGESNGAPKNNNVWPAAWRYRDYVIRSFNSDKPFDQFIREQIAGDLLPFDSDGQRTDQVAATAFLALGSKPDAGTKMDAIAEQLDVIGRSMLGIAIGCARCHDHKFDPITSHDFYAMGGIFHNTEILDRDPILPLQPSVKTSQLRKKRQASLATVIRTISQSNQRLEVSLSEAGIRRQPDESWADALRRFPNEGQRAKLNAVADELAKAEAELRKVHQQYESEVYETMAVRDRPAKGNKWMDLRFRIRGNEENLGDEVPRGVMQVLFTSEPPEIPKESSGRLQLAETLYRHPLAARVMVNRIWHHLFGRGLVRTTDDFGAMGDSPTHPELLEWLASRFVEDNYSIKKTVRRVVLSRTYQLTSMAPTNGDYLSIDSENTLLWRHSPRRLDAEALRDAILTVSGSLKLRQPDFFENELNAFTMTDTALIDRSDFRAVYLPVHRGQTTDLMSVFNAPPPSLVIGRRETPSVPTQALFLMNSPLVMEHAGRTAIRLLDARKTDGERIRLAYQHFYSRDSTEQEQAEAAEFLARFTNDSDQVSADRRAWTMLCQAMYASAEFRFLR